VDAVNLWGGEQQIVIRAGGRRIDLKPGDSYGGWRVESADGQTVKLRSPSGKIQEAEAGSGE
jgi:hypothetical protein